MDDYQQIEAVQHPSRIEGQLHQRSQSYHSTPVQNRSISQLTQSMGQVHCDSNGKNFHGHLPDLQMLSGDESNFCEPMQQSVRDIDFESTFGSIKSNRNMPRHNDYSNQSQSENRYKASPGTTEQNYEQESVLKSTQSKSETKEKKTISTKTFAKGMMDVSLLTSNATQLRAVLSNLDHEFYYLLIWLITLSISLQILSSILLLMSDYYKTDVKEKDRQNQKKRKFLNFLSLAMVTVVTSLNILISVFSTSSYQAAQTQPSTAQGKMMPDIPQFSTSVPHSSRSEL